MKKSDPNIPTEVTMLKAARAILKQTETRLESLIYNEVRFSIAFAINELDEAINEFLAIKALIDNDRT